MPSLRRPDPQPLCRERHGAWGWRTDDLAAAAAAAGALPLGLAEAPLLAATLPLLFRRVGGRALPFVLVKAAGAPASPLVTPQGRFRGACPVALSTAPFLPGPAGLLWLDESSPLLTRGSGGVPFFGPEGLTAPARAAEAALRLWARDRRRAAKAAAALEREGLLCRLQHAAAGSGSLMVDAARLALLDGAAVERLQAQGALGLAWAHRVSLAHLNTLAHHARPVAGPAPHGLLAMMAAEAAELADRLDG